MILLCLCKVILYFFTMVNHHQTTIYFVQPPKKQILDGTPGPSCSHFSGTKSMGLIPDGGYIIVRLGPVNTLKNWISLLHCCSCHRSFLPEESFPDLAELRGQFGRLALDSHFALTHFAPKIPKKIHLHFAAPRNPCGTGLAKLRWPGRNVHILLKFISRLLRALTCRVWKLTEPEEVAKLPPQWQLWKVYDGDPPSQQEHVNILYIFILGGVTRIPKLF